MRSICVFCGSQVGINPLYAKVTRELGALMAENRIDLIFGGGGIGLMGILADAIMENGGRAIGVIPRFLSDRELGHSKLSELILVESMHQRKQKMAELADGFVALPGGFGTLEELCEILTWRQLKLVDKPIGVLNINGFFGYFEQFLKHMIKEGFLDEAHKNLFVLKENPVDLIKTFKYAATTDNQSIEKT